MPRSAEPARTALVQAAERLFAEHGIGATTVAAITRAADQKNKHAVGFHFGGKEQLVEAVLEKHRTQIGAVRSAMLADAPADADSRFIARVLVEPLAERMLDADGGPEYLRIQAELVSRPDPTLPDSGTTNDLVAFAERWAGRSAADLEAQSRLVALLVFHGLADFARRHPVPGRAEVDEFAALLVDDAAALLDVGARTGR